MNEARMNELASWIADAGLSGLPETALVEGFCDRLVAYGLPLLRAIAFIDTLHPIYEGRAFRWEKGKPGATLSEYGRSTEGELAERWQSSPFLRLLESGESVMRRRISALSETEFARFPELRADSITEYVAMVNRFAAAGVIGEMDCFYSSWMT